MSKPKILVVEDDPAITNLMRTTLNSQNYQYRAASSGASAIEESASFSPDVIILDLGLPDIEGVEVIHTIRGWSSVPIIVVSARTEDQDKVEALDAGADDYLTKPFSVEEFLARLRVSLRRSHAGESPTAEVSTYENGELHIDYVAGTASFQGTELHLTPIEYKLLRLLAKHTGKVLTHNFILKEIWGNALPSDIVSLRVFMATLRKKIESNPEKPQYIQTHVRVGYRMIRQEPPPSGS